MANIIFWSKTALTGGAAPALDSIDGDSLTDGDFAHVVVGGILYVYKLDADSGEDESPPSIIAPGTNAGTKRWILLEGYPKVSVDHNADGTHKTSNLLAQGVTISRGTNITVTVGSGGDYETINDALAALSAYYPLYVSGGFTAEISLLTGFEMAEQVLVSGIDLSWITITAVDASTTITRSALTVSFGGTYPAFGVIGGRLPIIGALFSMDTSGTATDRNFITARDGSFVKVSASCGCQYAGENGIVLYDASSAMLTGADFSHATGNGIYAHACVVQATGAIVSYAGNSGVLSAYTSSVDATNANGENASKYGFRVATGGNINAGGVTGTLSQAANTLTASGIIYRFT